jgi:triacylglycerol lipase
VSGDAVVPLIPQQRRRPQSMGTGGGVQPAGTGARWVSEVARILRPPEADAACMPKAREAVYQHPVWTNPELDLDGLPVLLVGGLASTPLSLDVMQDWLIRLNCRPRVSPVRYGVDCGERTTSDVADEARRLADTFGRRCVLIAHSRGGQFARAVAVRHAEVVRGLVTLGSPVNRLMGVRPVLRAEVVLLGALGTLGVPGLIGAGCLAGGCCRRFRADLRAPFPATVPFLSVYSRQDGLVDWRSCLDPSARHRAVTASHSGLLCSPEVLQVLVQELAALAGIGGGRQRRVIAESSQAA